MPSPVPSAPPNLLITGGAGFIGSNFTRYWLERHPGGRVVVLDALTYAGNLSSLKPVLSNPRLTFVRGDIATPGLAEGLLRDHELTAVVHLAAESHVDRSIDGPETFLQTNVIGTHTLLQAARRVWLQEGLAVSAGRFHYVSTDEVYGSIHPGDPPSTEESPYNPSSPYAASKAAGDHLVRAYHRTYGLPATISHCSNTYGPCQLPEKLIPLMLVNALSGKSLPIYGDGLNVRDWLHVDDGCQAIERVLLRGRDGETYNIAGLNQRTNLAVVSLLCQLIDQAFAAEPSLVTRFPGSSAARNQSTASLIAHVPDRPGHDRRYAMNALRVERELGFKPEVELEAGLRSTLTWYLENEEWWRGVMDGSYRDWIQKHYGSSVSF